MYRLKKDGTGLDSARQVSTQRTTTVHQRNILRSVHAMWCVKSVGNAKWVPAEELVKFMGRDVEEWMSQPISHGATRERVRRIRGLRDTLVSWMRPCTRAGGARHAPEIGYIAT